jgi:hypothetical protein
MISAEMAKSSEDPTTESAPMEGAESSNEATKSAGEASMVAGSISDMVSSAPTESSSDENKNEGGQVEATETVKKEWIGEGNEYATTADKTDGSNPSEASPTVTGATTKTSDAKKNKNGNSKHGESRKGQKEPTNDDDVSNKQENQLLAAGPVVSSTKKTRPPYSYDPDKVTLRFLFANRDGLTVTVECKPSDTVGEVKGQLLSVWPKGECFEE